jgi:uncharacterized protein YndB with AHSA1/START domain
LAAPTPGSRRRVSIERTFMAAIEDVWELWTTTDGIESWWGPEGFTVKVRRLDLRPGGELEYAMMATAPEQVEFLRKAGMPVTNEHRLSYTDVVPMERLAFNHLVDFVPNVPSYEATTTVEFDTDPQGVRMVLTLDAMHDEYWTDMAVKGWESELDKLTKRLTPA